MQSHEELFVLARTLKDVAQEAQSATFAEPLDAIEKAVETAGKAFSESWMGYHSRVTTPICGPRRQEHVSVKSGG